MTMTLLQKSFIAFALSLYGAMMIPAEQPSQQSTATKKLPAYEKFIKEEYDYNYRLHLEEHPHLSPDEQRAIEDRFEKLQQTDLTQLAKLSAEEDKKERCFFAQACVDMNEEQRLFDPTLDDGARKIILFELSDRFYTALWDRRYAHRVRLAEAIPVLRPYLAIRAPLLPGDRIRDVRPQRQSSSCRKTTQVTLRGAN